MDTRLIIASYFELEEALIIFPDIADKAIKRYYTLPSYDDAIRSNHINTFKYIIGSGRVILMSEVRSIAKFGRLNMLKYLIENSVTIKDNISIDPIKFPKDLIYPAIECGHLNIIGYLYQINQIYTGPTSENYIMYKAFDSGNLDIIKYLNLKGLKYPYFSMEHALMDGNLNLIKFLDDNGVEFPKNFIDYARGKNISMIEKYFESKGHK